MLQLKEAIEKESVIRYQKFEDIQVYYGLLYEDLNKYLSEKYPPISRDDDILTKNKQPVQEIKKEKPQNRLTQYPKSKPYFAGREEDLQKLHDAYKTNPFIFIDGPGGIGKTQFVAKFIESLSDKSKVVWYECHPTSQPDDIISGAGFDELLKGKEKPEREKHSAF